MFRSSERPSISRVNDTGAMSLTARYWRNNTYYIVTDQPWALPETKLMMQGGTRDDERGLPAPLELLSVRQKAISVHVNEKNQLGKTISPADAFTFTMSAEDLPSPAVSLVCFPSH